MKEDERLISHPDSLSNNKRNALIVRISEKRILERCRRHIEDAQRRLKEDEEGEKKSKKSKQSMSEVNERKRRRDGEDSNGKKKKR